MNETIEGKCALFGCNRTYYAKKYCYLHYERSWRTGSPGALDPSEPNESCSISTCDREHHARGYCTMHYQRWKRHGDPLYTQKFARDYTCVAPGCDNPGDSLKLCTKHYQRMVHHGSLEVESPSFETPEESFDYRTKWAGDCLIWTGRKHRGYGRMWVDGKETLSHRYAWQRTIGPIPEGIEIDHMCHNRACVNVKHLRLASKSQNQQNRRGPSPTGSSGVRNVHRKNDKWQVKLTKDKRTYYFGVYSTIEEAAEVAEQARKELFGEFAGRG